MLDIFHRTSWLVVGGVVAVGIAVIAYFSLGYPAKLWESDAPAATAPVSE